MSIGQRIKARRKELEMSVDEVASKLGKNRATIYRYESNEIENLPITVLEPLAEILNVSPSYLMGWDDAILNDIPLALLENYQEKGMTEPEMIEAYVTFREAELNDQRNDRKETNLSEVEILTQAAHNIGHEGPLSEEEIEKVKLAIQIALAKSKK